MRSNRWRSGLAALLAVLLAVTGLLALPAKAGERPGTAATATPVPEGPITDPQSIADYLFTHGELPENFLTKQEARDLGWDSRYNWLSDVAPGMSIGGDRFGNYEERLPVRRGREYREADCYYTRGKRNAHRVIYSNDGRVWYTGDHYKTFTELFPTVPLDGTPVPWPTATPRPWW